MADQNKRFGETAAKMLGLPSAHELSELDETQREAYWAVAQALRFLKEGKPLYGRVARDLPRHADALRARWPDLPETVPQDADGPIWIERLKEAAYASIRAARPPAAQKMLQYFYEVAQLTDTAALDQLPSTALVALDLKLLWASPPESRQLPETKVLLLFTITRGAKRTTLLRCALAAEAGASAFSPAGQFPVTLSKTAFFTPDGEPRGDFSPEDIGELLLAPFPLEALASWPQFMALLDTRCEQLTGHGLLDLPQQLFGNTAPNLQAFLVSANVLNSMELPKIIGPLVRGERASRFLDAILAERRPAQTVDIRDARRDLFLGHMDERAGEGRQGFPLDPTQRLAAMTALSMGDTEHLPIVPVNGPPGTGKTSFLRAVLASKWVRAAYDEAESPPLVVGTGATNKAVSNVIEAFSTVAGSGEGIDSRWVDGLPSYGWLFPSSEAAQSYPAMMHLVFDRLNKAPYTVDGAALDFRLTDIAVHEATYIERGKRALKIRTPDDIDVSAIVAELHKRIASSVDTLRASQREFGRLLQNLLSSWDAAAGARKKIAADQVQIPVQQGMCRQLESEVQCLTHAVASVRACLVLQADLETGLKRWLRRLLGDGLLRAPLAQLDALVSTARQAVASTGERWPNSYAERLALLNRLQDLSETATEKLKASRKVLVESEHRYSAKVHAHAQSRAAMKAVLNTLDVPERMPPGERHSIIYALRYVRSAHDHERQRAEAMLWHRFDAGQDRQYRFELFHLAARYWEGRWLLRQKDSSPKISHQERLSRLMMLGVIIVATTHKLPAIGKDTLIDLLVVDESGQCAPEVGIAMLSFAKSALLVGDTKQLQPVSGLTEQQSLHLAQALDLTVPAAFCAARGSAMALARFVTPFTDQVDGNGVTLLYHYRCHPSIIGYCNDLLYGGKIRCVRPDKPTASGLPPMSWVEVAGSPIRMGTSQANEGELQEIARWIRESHQHLCTVYGKPLDEVLAVITPLKAQATKARSYLTQALADDIPKSILDRITIGTVHALQGAERPVVAFSLVQHRQAGSLFADRDGGFLMNVAVSRAKDAFIVFADRATLRAGPTDTPAIPAQERRPVGQLGAYLRRKGTRLYPRLLVVVEAKNKVARIQQVLGTNCAVIPTNGALGMWSLEEHGGLVSSPAPVEFVASLEAHAGLVDELLVATDDDLAGELIGLQVAEVASDTLKDVPIRRMRFHSLEEQQLRDALTVAGPHFDVDLLAAALLREAMNGLDRQRFKSRLPDLPYAGASERALVAMVDEFDQGDAWCIEAILEDGAGHSFPAYVPDNEAILAMPAVVSAEAAQSLVQKLQGTTVTRQDRGTVQRVAALYPSSSTQRILAAAADELGMMPWDAQSHLNAMYQQGAEVEDNR